MAATALSPINTAVSVLYPTFLSRALFMPLPTLRLAEPVAAFLAIPSPEALMALVILLAPNRPTPNCAKSSTTLPVAVTGLGTNEDNISPLYDSSSIKSQSLPIASPVRSTAPSRMPAPNWMVSSTASVAPCKTPFATSPTVPKNPSSSAFCLSNAM